jgi:acetyltransferase
MPEEGSIAFLSQSGALCTAVLDYARAKEIGFSKFISFGNKADISEIDLLYYLKDDPKTRVILIYLEEVTDGVGLMKVAKEIIHDTGKPILIMKSGRTGAGAKAAASHTGSLAGSDEICDAAFKQAGIIRCDNIEEMFNKARRSPINGAAGQTGSDRDQRRRSGSTDYRRYDSRRPGISAVQ